MKVNNTIAQEILAEGQIITQEEHEVFDSKETVFIVKYDEEIYYMTFENNVCTFFMRKVEKED